MKKTSQTNTTVELKKEQLSNTTGQSLNATEESGNFAWLTDHSRQFLSSGYLSQGETSEERIKAIADNAEKILNIPGFSDKFYYYMSEGFYSLASPVWSNFGKERVAYQLLWF